MSSVRYVVAVGRVARRFRRAVLLCVIRRSLRFWRRVVDVIQPDEVPDLVNDLRKDRWSTVSRLRSGTRDGGKEQGADDQTSDEQLLHITLHESSSDDFVQMWRAPSITGEFRAACFPTRLRRKRGRWGLKRHLEVCACRVVQVRDAIFDEIRGDRSPCSNRLKFVYNGSG